MTEDVFVRAVLADPEDDGPRLIFADWLDEQGEGERAEFIRVQCRLEREPCPHDYEGGGITLLRNNIVGCPCDFCRLRARERELLGLGRDRWFDHWLTSWTSDLAADMVAGYYPENSNVPAVLAGFRRGFVESLTLTAADWLAHAEAMLSCQPVREVRLTTWPTNDGRPFGAREHVEAAMADQWPGVKFALPPAVYDDFTPSDGDALPEGARGDSP